jgi:phosphoribosylformylglycinamidine synthase
MAFAGGLGAKVYLKAVPLGEEIERDDFILFSESNSRFIVEVPPENKENFERVMSGTSIGNIGTVTDSMKLEIYGEGRRKIVSESIFDLKEAWQKPLRW